MKFDFNILSEEENFHELFESRILIQQLLATIEKFKKKRTAAGAKRIRLESMALQKRLQAFRVKSTKVFAKLKELKKNVNEN